MRIIIHTERQIDGKDLSAWLSMYQHECGYPIDEMELRRSGTKAWASNQPEFRSFVTTTITLVEE